MKSLHKIDCTNKHVLVRVDFNIDIHALTNQVESFRLTLTKDTVAYILGFPGARVTLITHLGRPGGKKDMQFSTKPLQKVLENIFGETVSFTPDCLESDDFTESRIALRENIRFYPEEEANESMFAEKLSADFDVYVNEAFSVSHRAHASIVAITHFLPSFAGLHLQKELIELTKVLLEPARPAVAILGGAKIKTKLPLIHVFEKHYDFVLLGGIIANEALDKKIVFQENVLLPMDFRNEERLDIGDATIKKYENTIAQAKTILWNGPLGKFEEQPYDTGTSAIVNAITKADAYTIAGGGESLTAIQKAGAFDKFDIISSGGGAMLSYLSEEKLPGLEALNASASLS